MSADKTNENEQKSQRIIQFGIQELDLLLGRRGKTIESPSKNSTPVEGHEKESSAGKQASGQQTAKVMNQKQERFGLFIETDKETGTDAATSIAIVGPDGTGKSILALHLASRYAAQCFHENLDPPAVLYASTDLSFSKAQSIWDNFGLGFSKERDKALCNNAEIEYASEIELKQYRPHADPSVSKPPAILEYILPPYNEANPEEVAFVDLEEHTAGDDWGFLTRLITSMSRPRADQPLHIVIIDAIEGLQTMNGERDFYGEERNRRSRIAQLIRAAIRKCHLVFIVEEPKSEERFPEQFVADAVIRLRNLASKHGYNHRTIEVEKVRAQTHVRGQHIYAIRSGHGSSTGKHMNPDEPRRTLSRGNHSASDELLSYVIVYPSIDFCYRVEMQRQADSAKDVSNKVIHNLDFGIEYLDSMLAKKDENNISGIPARSVTGIIGPAKTHKTQLGRAFLSMCFVGLKELISSEDNIARLRKRVSKYLIVKNDSNIYKYEEWLKSARRRTYKYYGSWISYFIVDYSNSKVVLEDKLIWLEITEKLLNEIIKNYGISPTDGTRIDDINNIIKARESVIQEKESINKSLIEVKRKIKPLMSQVRKKLKASDPDEYKMPGVAILITTEDINATSLASKFHDWLFKKSEQQVRVEIEKSKLQNEDTTLKELSLEAALAYAESRTICRRLEVHSLTSSVLFHIIKKAVQKAKNILIPGLNNRIAEPSKEDLKKELESFSQIRLVIDNWSAIASTYPSVREDPLFLPYLFFYLRREGVTTLILENQSYGNLPAFSQAYESSLTNLVDHTILTWNVRFHGKRMTAISPLTAFSPGQRSVVHEVTRTDESLSADMDIINVDPHLDLYQNLLSGEPSPVPLHVRLFTEGPWANEYAQSVNTLLRDIFPPLEKYGNNIVSATPHPFDEHGENRYERLKQISWLHTDSLDHTVVWQVDEFWGVHGEDGKMKLNDYLNCYTDTDNKEQDNIADPYSTFRLYEGLQQEVDGKRRIDFFDLDKLQYDGCEMEGNSDFDRVPYTWDFGFLLCRSEAWKRALERKLPTTIVRKSKKQDDIADGRNTKVELHVKDVWNALISGSSLDNKPGNGNHEETEKSNRAGTWRYFLEACQVVSQSNRGTTVPLPATFDLSVLTPESVSCLVLEIWMSEVYSRLMRESKNEEADNLMNAVGGKRSLKTAPIIEHSLTTLIEKFSDDLYKTLILLFEVIDCKGLINRGKVASYNIRDAAPNAIAVRHWYKTASGTAQNYEPSDPLVPVRLPGNFSVRGDWFLAIAKGSRSLRLGERALDLMTSRRSNIYRLQLGVGLPTRKLMEEDGYKGLQTSLYTNRETVTATYKPDNQTELEYEVAKPSHNSDKTEWYLGSHRKPLSYQELLELGALPPKPKPNGMAFSWLWRSHLKHYDRHARIWHNWLCRLLVDFEDIRRSRGPDWIGGFKEYDIISLSPKPGGPAQSNLEKFETYNKFNKSRTLILVELQSATLRDR